MENKEIPEYKTEYFKNFTKDSKNYLFVLLGMILGLVLLWKYFPMHNTAKGITTFIIVSFCYKAIFAVLKFFAGAIGLTDTSVLREDRPEKYFEEKKE